ncbi:DUF4861 domain-containing protein [bacterium]|nr:DUF4861 domain-containing protein [bacterium]
MKNCMFITMLLISGMLSSASAQTNNDLFVRMVGRKVLMDEAISARVLRAGPGSRVTVDSDGDGKIDTLYMIDTDDRHKNARAPLLVKVVDEDGDMFVNGEGDLDSDLYIADWYGDGTIDRVVDYIDLDNDNDVDEQVLYQWSDMAHFLAQSPRNFDGKAYCAVWAKDYGDDNRLWYDINYEYSQPTTQWLTDFNGDEIFVYAFFYDYDNNRFIPGFENPFAFYDLDGDSYSEEVVRLGADGLTAKTLRYSMDIDNDSRGSNRHDYDFSVSAFGPVAVPSDRCMKLTLRGIDTGQFIGWDHVRRVAKTGKWKKVHFTWDENDNNIDPVEGRQHYERWEGVINFGKDYDTQVGGPSCGPYNKRNEIDFEGSGDFRFYYSPVDRRIHLYGADIGWIKVDYDYDNRPDMVISMEDKDKDGFFDTWKYDVDADSTFDREYKTALYTAELYPLDYQILHELYMPTLTGALNDNQTLIETLKAVLVKVGKDFTPDPVETYFNTELSGYGGEFHLGEKIRNSMEGTRYYGDLIRERYWHRLCESPVSRNAVFPEIKTAYETGDYSRTSQLLEKQVLGKAVSAWYGSYTKRFTIELTNPGERYLENHPFVLGIDGIIKGIPDFNPCNYSIVETERRIDWRPVPSQADDIDGDGRPDELVFVHSLLPSSTTKLYCFYSPPGTAAVSYPMKTDTHRDWLDLKVNIGWESNWCGYRMYYGQIDFFGKRREGLRLKNTVESYHRISDWGMDVLHVGKSSGIGGISIWEGETRIPVMNPAGEGDVRIDRKIISSGPVRSLVRVDFTNVRSPGATYTVSMLMSAFADNRFSRQDIMVTSTAGDSVVYSPGLQKLPNDTWVIDSGTGVLASWGLSDHEIGDIGLGLMFDPEEYAGYAESGLDRYVKLRIPAGMRCTHWIIGGWRKGFPSPVAPSPKDWAREVEELGFGLRAPVHVGYKIE